MDGDSHSQEGSERVPDAQVEQSQPELRFVTLTGPPSLSNVTRTIVRSHAMQSFLHMKRSDGNTPVRIEPRAPLKRLGEGAGKFKLASWSRKSGRKSSSAASLVHSTMSSTSSGIGVNRRAGADRVDPEDYQAIKYTQTVLEGLDPSSVLLSSLSRGTRFLLHYYNTSFMMNSYALNPQGSWIALALTDGALLHATLSNVAWKLDMLRGIKESPECLYQQGQAIRLINEQLHDPAQGTRDTAIGTVATLAIFAAMNGTEQIAQIHMSGLERMVRLRGGLQSFTTCEILLRVLTWCDFLYSTTWGRIPVFPLVTTFVNNDATGTLLRFSTATNPSYPPPSSLLPFNLSLASVLESLRRITIAIASPDLGLADREAVSNQIYLAELFLLSSDISSSLPSALNPSAFSFGVNFDLAFRIAALLYLHIVIREVPHTAKMHHNPISNLAATLEPFSPFVPGLKEPVTVGSDSQSSQLELLAWMMFIGALASEERTERIVFVEMLSTVCATLFITTREDLRSRLQRILWRTGLCDGFLESLWGAIFVDSL